MFLPHFMAFCRLAALGVLAPLAGQWRERRDMPIRRPSEAAEPGGFTFCRLR